MVIDTKEMVSVMLTKIEIADIDVRGLNRPDVIRFDLINYYYLLKLADISLHSKFISEELELLLKAVYDPSEATGNIAAPEDLVGAIEMYLRKHTTQEHIEYRNGRTILFKAPPLLKKVKHLTLLECAKLIDIAERRIQDAGW